MAISETQAKTATLKEKGMQVSSPTGQFKSELQEIGQVMGKEWAAEAGETGSEILKAMQ